MYTSKIFKISNNTNTLLKIMNGSKTIIFGHVLNRNSKNLLNLKKLLNNLGSSFITVSPKLIKLLYYPKNRELYNLSKGNVILIYSKGTTDIFNKNIIKSLLKINNIKINGLLSGFKLYRIDQILKIETLDDNMQMKQLFTFKTFNENTSKNILQLKKNF